MQIMPDNWADLRSRYGLGSDPFDAHDNILAGTAYFRKLLDQYREAGFVAAHNAGPARYEQHLVNGQPPPAETQDYMAALASAVAGEHASGAATARSLLRRWTEAVLFVPQSGGNQTILPPPSAMHAHLQPANTAVADWTALAPQSGALFVAVYRPPVRP